MLNELFHLSESLRQSSVNIQSRHKHFKDLPGGEAFFVELDDQGSVVNVSSITAPEIRSGLRKYEKAAGYSFPSFNVPPLLRFESDREKERAAKLRKMLGSKNPPGMLALDEELEHLLSVSASAWKDQMDRINGCLFSVTQSLTAMLGECTDESRSFVELLRRARQTDGYALYEQLKDIAVHRVKSATPKPAKWMDMLFFHSGKDPKKIIVVLELVDQSQFEYPANYPDVLAWVNSRLQDAEIAEEDKQERPVLLDAFAVEGGGIYGKFPEVKIPVLRNVKLRAMNSESPCQRRYGLADAKSFRVSQPARQSMKNALEWITRDERHGKTWRDVSSTSGGQAVLIAYPSELPPEAPELAGLLGGVEEEQFDPDGARFEACAHRVAEALKGQPATSQNAELRVLVLTKPDGYRTKVLHSSRYTVKHLLDSASEWQDLCRNSPLVTIRQFGLEKGNKTFWQRPYTPYPAEVVWCLNTVWKRMGKYAKTARDFQIADGLSLLLADGPVLHTVVIRAVRAIISNSFSLLLEIGQASHKWEVHPMGEVYRKQALLLPSILGLILGKLNYKKGIYMKSPSYLIGRLLSLADQLHVRYCHEVRKGQVPPQLVGNALMTSAMETPLRALALLWQRIKPYHAWAQTIQGGDEVRLVKHFLGEMGRVCASLSKTDLPSQCSETDKVAMLLGYLARSEKEKPDEHSSNASNEGE